MGERYMGQHGRTCSPFLESRLSLICVHCFLGRCIHNLWKFHAYRYILGHFCRDLNNVPIYLPSLRAIHLHLCHTPLSTLLPSAGAHATLSTPPSTTHKHGPYAAM